VIVTVTANAAVDRTLRVGRLERGARTSVVEERVQAGGKGVNVARVLRGLGVPVHAVVVVGGAAGDAIVDDLAASDVPATVVRAPGESRTCLEVVEDDGVVTQLHGPGVEGSEAVAGALLAACTDLAPTARWLALCGSLAPGMPPDTAARIVRLAARQGLRSAVDTRGPALAVALAEAPDVAHANAEELAEALGCTPEEAVADPRLAAIGLAVWSAGAGPVRARSAAEGCFTTRPPTVTVRNPVGCGDALLAGLLARLDAGAGAAEALRFATALGAADAESPCAGRSDPGRARTLAGQVVVEDARGCTVLDRVG
jgi:1-phosphofructokinase family hexose kinase